MLRKLRELIYRGDKPENPSERTRFDVEKPDWYGDVPVVAHFFAPYNKDKEAQRQAVRDLVTEKIGEDAYYPGIRESPEDVYDPATGKIDAGDDDLYDVAIYSLGPAKPSHPDIDDELKRLEEERRVKEQGHLEDLQTVDDKYDLQGVVATNLPKVHVLESGRIIDHVDPQPDDSPVSILNDETIRDVMKEEPSINPAISEFAHDNDIPYAYIPYKEIWDRSGL